MITEVAYITDYINKNHEVVILPHGFGVLNKSNGRKITFDSWKTELFIIFTKSCYPIIKKWYTDKSDNLTKDLKERISKIKYQGGPSMDLYESLVKEFDTDPNTKNKYTASFIKRYFYEHHKNTNIIPKLEEIVKTIKDADGIMNVVAEFIELEPSDIRDFIIEYVNEWYTTSIIGERITDFFRQLVVTDSINGWKVTWIGHGELTRDKIRYVFESESEQIIKIIFKKYSKWYEDEIIDYSERKIQKNLVYR
jgi:hypothetical protein